MVVNNYLKNEITSNMSLIKGKDDEQQMAEYIETVVEKIEQLQSAVITGLDILGKDGVMVPNQLDKLTQLQGLCDVITYENDCASLIAESWNKKSSDL